MDSKKLFLPALATLVLVLSACSPAAPEEASQGVVDEDVQAAISEEPEASAQDVEVDRGLLSVEITIPKEFFEGTTEDEIYAQAEEDGYTSAVINDDGSVTYKMPRSIHQGLLQEMKDGIDETIDEAIAENPDLFRKVTYNSSVSRFTVTVNQSAFEASFEAPFIGFGLGLGGLFYQIFDGVPKDKQEVIIDFVDEESGAVFDTQRWPGEE